MFAASVEGLQALLTAEFAALGRCRVAPRDAAELVEEEPEDLEDPELGAERRYEQLREIEPAPCQGCIQASRCSAQLLACSVFKDFVMHGGVDRWPEVLRSPTRQLFDRIFHRPRDRADHELGRSPGSSSSLRLR